MHHPFPHPADPEDLPLAGLKVLDFAQGIAGPHATMLLAQYGAEVIKVEPLAGDWGRTLGKAYGDLSAHAVAFNRGKKSLAVDLKNPDALAIVRRMAAEADVIAESFRPGVMARFGLGYESLARGNPALVYLSVSGFGQQGPNRDLPATDAVLQAYTGWMFMNKNAEGIPQRSGMVAVDVMTGLYAYQAIASALIRRFRSGQGRYIDCSLMQAAAAFQCAKMMEYHLENGAPAGLYVPVGCFETADGYINVTSMRDHHYDALCKVIDREDLIADPRYDSRPKRLENEASLMAELRREFLRKPAREWAQLLTAAGVMNGIVSNYRDFLEAEHVREVGVVDWTDHPDVGRVPVLRIPGVPGKPSEDPARAHAPHVGEQTRPILEAQGVGNGEIERLAAAGAIGLPH
jgi:crotonobetainyl-CoA:carnitine CoA-transferase CaiB-like acyl-CoA transferase